MKIHFRYMYGLYNRCNWCLFESGNWIKYHCDHAPETLNLELKTQL